MLLRKMMKIPNKLSSKLINSFSQIQYLSQMSAKPKDNVHGKMLAWQIHYYADKNDPHLSRVRIPILSRPSEVLIKVDASSVNPIDIAMTCKLLIFKNYYCFRWLWLKNF
jgi:hypothetical protein